MGRKTLPRSKVRQVLSISLPQHVIDRLDNTLNGRTRSRVIEGLIELSLKNKNLITDFNESRHVWSCLDCSNEWSTDRPLNRTLKCIKGSCGSLNIKYQGVMEDFE